MPISEGTLNEWHKDAENLAAALEVSVKKFTPDELDRFGRSFERQFVLAIKQREITDLYMRHAVEILTGALVMKEQADQLFDGERPAGGRFGMVWPRAGFFGIGDDWTDVSAFTLGSPQNWIHSGTTLMGGTASNAVKIGKKAVHVIFAVDTLHLTPKIESIQLTIDGKPKPVIVTTWPWTNSDFRAKELDVGFLLKKDTTLLAKVFLPGSGSALDYPHLYGVSFTTEDILRIYHDVVSLPGTGPDVIMTT